MRSQKRKRGTERKDRRMGLPKDGDPLPPVGTPRWMISKKWITEMHRKDVHLGKIVDDLLEGEEEEIQSDLLASLGEESDEEIDLASATTYQTVDQLDPSTFTNWQYSAGYVE